MRSIYISLKLVITRLNKVVVLGEFLPGEFWVSFFDEFFWVSFSPSTFAANNPIVFSIFFETVICNFLSNMTCPSS